MTTPVKIKLEPGARYPTKATDGSAAYDTYALHNCIIRVGYSVRLSLGFSLELPKGYCALLFMRSGLSLCGYRLTNGVGLIDSDYRGNVSAPLSLAYEFEGLDYSEIKKGDRVVQLMVQRVPDTSLILTDELSTTDRGEGGFGSTGTNGLDLPDLV